LKIGLKLCILGIYQYYLQKVLGLFINKIGKRLMWTEEGRKSRTDEELEWTRPAIHPEKCRKEVDL
jgi:hypothetical protein